MSFVRVPRSGISNTSVSKFMKIVIYITSLAWKVTKNGNIDIDNLIIIINLINI